LRNRRGSRQGCAGIHPHAEQPEDRYVAALDLKSLISKLNDPCRKAIESGLGLAVSRTNFNLELEHWLLALLEVQDSDLNRILPRYEADLSRFKADLTRAVDRFKTGNGRAPGISPQVVSTIKDAWLIASVDKGEPFVRSGHILLAILGDDGLGGMRDVSSQLARLQFEVLKRDFAAATEGSAEEKASAAASDVASGGAPGVKRPGKSSGALELYTTDLTERAKSGKMDPVLGRDMEIRQCIDILTRRRQNNPILTGEAGVGKTSVVEGLAQKIVAGDVPPALRNNVLRVLDLGLLQAGAGMKGEFENRLNGVISDVKASPVPIILFIDEAHMMIGAGGQAGQGDAANLLKPALARGELRTVAATTWAEYKKYFERDPALTRRFQVVKVEEPSEAVGIEMLRGLSDVMEKHHKVRVLDEAVQDAVKLSNRYISGRQLPDKAIGVLDTACARVGMMLAATPAPIETLTNNNKLLANRIAIMEREALAGAGHEAAIAEARAKLEADTAELAALNARWEQEKAIVSEATALRTELEGGVTEALRPEKQAALKAKMDELAALQGENPLVLPFVDAQAVAQIVGDWTGIPVGRMLKDEITTVMELDQRMKERVVGQDHALEIIAKTVQTARAGLADPRKPIGVFMFVGTSGTGKTETALALADLLYGGDQALTVINMSEFKEEHKVSMLVGSPPGYVGYGEGGVLTEAVRRHPYSVVLLDEVEKAHPGVQDVFYQVFDKGMLRDGEGRDIDFKNTLIILTSNAATELMHKLCADPDTRPTPDALADAIRPELLKTFKPAFLGRITLVPYYALDDATIRLIVGMNLKKITRRVRETYKAETTFAPELVEAIAKRCTEVESGARNIEQIISRTMLPELAGRFLARMADGQGVSKLHVGIDGDGNFEYLLN
jgi:type VI secretion system protein VasG